MAKLSTDDYSITINSNDFSDHLVNVDLPLEKASYDATGFGMGWQEQVMSPIKGGEVTLEFHQNYAASKINAIIWPLFIGSGYATVVAKPTSGGVSPTNPSFTAVCVPRQYKPIGGAIRNLAGLSVTWPTHGTVAMGTA